PGTTPAWPNWKRRPSQERQGVGSTPAAGTTTKTTWRKEDDMNAVLFLDVDWQPMRVDAWTRAITDLFLGKVEVIEYSRDRTIKGVDREYPMPAVVRVLRRFRRDRVVIKFSRINIYTRDRFTCQYCAERFLAEDLTFDHVVPRSAGGRTSWDNIVTA